MAVPRGVEFRRLMRESESVVEETARSGDPEQRAIAQRIILHPLTYRIWESRHAQLMRQVSEHRRMPRQAVALRAATLALIHRKALFEHLRDRQVRGAPRLQIFQLFYGTRDYARAVVTEHGHFLRNASSCYCTEHIGAILLRDTAFEGPVAAYEHQYAEFFRIYCEAMLSSGTPTESAAQHALARYLKQRLADTRRIILGIGYRS